MGEGGSGAGGAPSYDTASLAIFAAMSTPPTTTRKGQIDTCVTSLKSAGVWSLLSMMHLMAAADSQAASINWINPATFTFSTVGSPTFTADLGYTFNGTSNYLNTGFTPSTAGGNFALSSASFGVYVNGGPTGTSGSVQLGVNSGTDYMYIRANNSAGATGIEGAVNDPAGGLSTPVATAFGLSAINRSTSTALQYYKNGVSVATAVKTSTALPSQPVYIGAYNAGGSPGAFTTSRIAFEFMGGSLSGTQQTALYNAVLAYLTAIGGN